MSKSLSPNLPILQLTVGEFVELIRDNIDLIPKEIKDTSENKETEAVDENLAYGLIGLANLLGVSKTHASRLKSKGMFKSAIKQHGRTIIIDKKLALEEFNNKK